MFTFSCKLSRPSISWLPFAKRRWEEEIALPSINPATERLAPIETSPSTRNTPLNAISLSATKKWDKDRVSIASAARRENRTVAGINSSCSATELSNVFWISTSLIVWEKSWPIRQPLGQVLVNEDISTGPIRTREYETSNRWQLYIVTQVSTSKNATHLRWQNRLPCVQLRS